MNWNEIYQLCRFTVDNFSTIKDIKHLIEVNEQPLIRSVKKHGNLYYLYRENDDSHIPYTDIFSDYSYSIKIHNHYLFLEEQDYDISKDFDPVFFTLEYGRPPKTIINNFSILKEIINELE